MPDFESMIPYYRSRMTRGERATKPQHIFVEQCKAKYNFVDYTTTKTSNKKKAPYAASLDAVRSLVSDSIFSAIFHYDSNQITDMRPLFRIGDKEYNSRDFARFISKNKKVRPICILDSFVVDSYHDFIDAKVLEYADSRLELDIPEFGELIDEYRHGLMIFAYNDQMVWSRALKDTLGFERFYAQASKKHHWGDSADAVYFWNERARVNCYTIADSTLLSKNKALKVIEKGHKKGWGTEKVIEELVAKVSKKDASKVSNELILVEKGNQQLLSNKEWGMGTYVHNLDSGSYQILVVEQMLQPELKSRDEARGFYLNDFQNYLEDQNNTALRKKYNVKIHQDVLDKIVY
jgi:peptidyl-prolyl cis-trans isomerase SurA